MLPAVLCYSDTYKRTDGQTFDSVTSKTHCYVNKYCMHHEFFLYEIFYYAIQSTKKFQMGRPATLTIYMKDDRYLNPSISVRLLQKGV